MSRRHKPANLDAVALLLGAILGVILLLGTWLYRSLKQVQP